MPAAAGAVAWPAGASDAAAIEHALLPVLDHYNSEDNRKRVLEVIAKIPRADEGARYYRTLSVAFNQLAGESLIILVAELPTQ